MVGPGFAQGDRIVKGTKCTKHNMFHRDVSSNIANNVPAVKIIHCDKLTTAAPGDRDTSGKCGEKKR